MNQEMSTLLVGQKMTNLLVGFIITGNLGPEKKQNKTKTNIGLSAKTVLGVNINI